ncbi:MAG: NepR family anti-sigma factor [Sphingomicrobium sp.]
MSEHKNDGSSHDVDAPTRSGESSTAKRASSKDKKSGDVGKALRSVYDSTLREDVPSDFMDLLGKLD